MEQEKTTKGKILSVAARLFALKSYDRVTTREIAKEVGINAASIYYYFSSKDEILMCLYEFYSNYLKSKSPDLNQLLILAETEPPHEVLMKSEFHFEEDLMEMLDYIIIVATRMINADPESERFIKENLFDPITNILKPLLVRLVELERIKPFDIDTFLSILSYYCFSAAALNKASFGQSITQYQAAIAYLFSMIEVN